jgi:hypothetical protein
MPSLQGCQPSRKPGIIFMHETRAIQEAVSDPDANGADHTAPDINSESSSYLLTLCQLQKSYM